MNACHWKPSTVTLHDGRQVASDSEEWRHECEARAVIAMRDRNARRHYLRGRVLPKRGIAATERLEQTIRQIWYAR